MSAASGPAEEQSALASVRKQLLIGGTWRPGEGGRSIAVEDPASGETIAEVADATLAEARAALGAAADAQAGFAAMAPRERGEILRRAYERMIAERERIALLMSLEMGKTLAESDAEVLYAAEFFRWFAEEAVRIHGTYMRNPTGAGRILTMRAPVGPCLLITPWNFPAAMAARKIAPAVAAGCTMVVKPAKQTPLCTLAIAEILREEGLPPGALNVVTTSDSAAVVEPLLDDPRLRKLSFTGSTAVGRALMGRAAGGLLRLSLELGGNAPFLVFADADIEQAIGGALAAKLRNIGEACTAANRFLVEASIAERFAAELAERMRTLRSGRFSDPHSDLGPLIDGAQRAKVARLVEEARGRGARVLCGGQVPEGPGYFYPPTVLSDVPAEAEIAREEIFGPVAAIYAFDSEAQALALANGTEYGLVAYLYTQSLERALRVSEALEFGMVGVNQGVVSNPAAPFGGVKQSGFGREGGFEGIGEYLSTRYLALSL
ncbi:MAG TPA: NAD-dependent succinate-semialdehyde dehydrogenase [Solirubrobacteraceae bacterium]|nr:NAD-dependent succinate-semialdehyde dehydrogenase [Solirubrobacteraceae bacterium]